MTDDFEESLRETLAGAVPTPPEEPGRASGARSYSRRVRRTRAALAVGAAAAVVGAVVVIPNVVATSDNTANPGIETPDARPALVLPAIDHPYVCARSRVNGGSPPHGVVPAGAVLARICPSTSHARAWSAPTEPLVTDVEGLTRMVNSRQDVTAARVLCLPAPDGAIAYRMTFQYPDGHTVSVDGRTGGCNVINAGAKTRLGASVLLRDYLNRLHDQRVRYRPTQSHNASLSCPTQLNDDPVLVDGRGPGLTRATVCSYLDAAGVPDLIQSGSLTTKQSAQVNADLAAHATRQQSQSHLIDRCQASMALRSGMAIRGVNAWGDQIELSAQCSAYTFFDREGTWYWTPTQETAAMLRLAMRATGRLSGRLQSVGGPPPGLPQPIPGRIAVKGLDSTQYLAVGGDGRFTLSLAVGRYRVRGFGYGASYNDGRTPCQPAHPFVNVLPHKEVRVDVLCQLR